MKNLKTTAIALLALVSTLTFAQDYSATPDKSTIKWTGEKVTGKHYGMINLKSGNFTIKGDKITSGEFIIDMTTITVDDLEGEWKEKLTGHLNSDDFFGVENYPTAKLVITNSSKFKNGLASITGDLSIKGKTHPVTFEVKQNGKTFSSTIVVDRTLYDIRYGSGKFFDNLGDKTISDEFQLEVKLETK